MDPFTSAFSSAYLANIAGALTGGMISGAGRRIKSYLEDPPARQALQRCVYMGTIAAVTIAKTETPEEENLLAEILKKFFNDPEMIRELNSLLLGRFPNREEFRFLFEEAGYDDQTLPGVQFDAAMDAFESGFITAALQEEALQSFIQTGQILGQSNLQREILAAVRELVAFIKEEGADQIIGILGRSILSETGKQITYHPDAPKEAGGGNRYSSHGNHVQGVTQSENIHTVINNFYGTPQPLESAPEPAPKEGHNFGEAISAYRTKAENQYGKLLPAGFKTHLRVPIRIEEIYIPLHAMIDLRGVGDACFADSEDAEKRLRQAGISREILFSDAFQYIEKMNRRGIVILGDPGSGKTTHLKRLLLWCLQCGFRQPGLPDTIIPVFLPLRELKDLTKGIDVFIQDQLDRPHLETPDNFGKQLLNRGNLLFLFDGLDEVAEPEDRVQVSRWIEEALEAHSNCRFVVTCRFAGYTPEARLNEEFLEMHMRPFNKEQAEAFILKWYKTVETGLSPDADQARIIAEEKAGDLIERIRQPEFRARRVFELTRNPLLLTNLCLVHRDRGNLPYTRVKLYEECTDVLLELWRGAIGFPGKITAQTGRQVLQPAALWMHQEENRTRAKADDLAPVIDPVLKSVGWPHGSAKDFLKAVRDESGLLTGWDQENYGFMHLGFQEYLAALEIRKQASSDSSVLKDFASHFGESWWQEVVLLMLALEKPSLFVPFMKEALRQPAFSRHTDLIEACLDDATEVLIEPFLELLKTEPGTDSDLWKNQLSALRIIEQLDNSALVNFILRLEEHPYPRIRDWIRKWREKAIQEVIFGERGRYELVRITGGTFMMGSPEMEEDRDKNESPLHTIHLQGFYMGRYAVTNEEYGRFLRDKPNVVEPKFWADRKFNQPQQPVVGVSWNDAEKYASWAGLRLPTEAEWEYACRAGTRTRFNTGDFKEDLDRAGWYKGNSGSRLHPVGEKEPNAFGLYDMHGSVWEWVQDDWHSYYKDAPDDGCAWIDEPRGKGRVMRGGSWGSVAKVCRSAYRFGYIPSLQDSNVGFRLVRSLI